MSCPCCRQVMLQNDNSNIMNMRRNNEYFQPAIGSDFTQYLDQVRKNQLKFSKENYDIIIGAALVYSPLHIYLADTIKYFLSGDCKVLALNAVAKIVILGLLSIFAT